MHRPSAFPNHSFRLILYLEWILLGITLLGEIRPTPHEINVTTRLLSILTLMVFGLMGLGLPGKTHLNCGVLPPDPTGLAVRGIAGEQRVPPLSKLISVALNREGVGLARTINLRLQLDFQHIV